MLNTSSVLPFKRHLNEADTVVLSDDDERDPNMQRELICHALQQLTISHPEFKPFEHHSGGPSLLYCLANHVLSSPRASSSSSARTISSRESIAGNSFCLVNLNVRMRTSPLTKCFAPGQLEDHAY